MCMSFVALTVVEFQYVLRMRYDMAAPKSTLVNMLSKTNTEIGDKAKRKVLRRVDKLSARILLALFSLFTALYWTYFLIKSNKH